MDIEGDGNDADGEGAGAGVLGKVKKEEFEREMLGVFVETSCTCGLSFSSFLARILPFCLILHALLLSNTSSSLFLLAVQDVDPVQNTDSLAGIEEENLSFPFATPDEGELRSAAKPDADER